MLEALTEPFFQRVLLAGLLASVAAGVIGTYVVVRRIASLAGGLSHAAFGGVGLGYWAGFPPIAGAAGFALVASLVVGLAERRVRSGLDTLVALVWSVGMALGIVFVALAPGYTPDLTSYLFGSLLFVPWEYVAVAAAVDAVIVAAVLRYHRVFEAVCFDEEFAEVAGVPAERVFLGLLALAALAIVTLIRVVGVILAIALLTIPPAAARPWVSSLGAMMAASTAICAASTLGGLLLSWSLAEHAGLSIPPGPLIILLAAAGYAASHVVAALRGSGGPASRPS
ncbi:MAG: metal ABC transporter permease [Myxococcales bacterium]|nr:metal ABC transporter permease [Myxococcales bacterium]